MTAEYNRFAALYDPLLSWALRSVRKTVIAELSDRTDAIILDMCCGTGKQLKLLHEHRFRHLHCLDISEAMLAIAEKGDHNIVVHLKDATRTGFPDAMFDVVLVSFAIHEKDGETHGRMLDEAHRVLKPGGTLLIADYRFTPISRNVARWAIHLVERVAGGDHYRNFREYCRRGGLDAIMGNRPFRLLHHQPVLMNNGTVARYEKTVETS